MTAPSLKRYVQGASEVSADNLNTFMQTCNTLDNLRAFTGLPGIQVCVRGGAVVDDGGGGFYYWSANATAVDNGTTVIAPTGTAVGRWLRLAPIGSPDIPGIFNVLDFGAAGDGVTDDATAINNAISAATAAGGGVVLFPAGTYAVGSTITLRDNVTLSGVFAGSTITWIGTTGDMLASSSGSILLRAGIENLRIDSGSADRLLVTYGAYECSFQRLRLTGASATAVAIDVRADSSGGTNPAGNRNAAFCCFSDILHDGYCGRFIRLIGLTGTPQVVTLNTFNSCNALDVREVGIDFAEWCDNNSFTGMTRVAITDDNAIGVYYTSAHASNNLGVYSNNFEMLAVDNFGSPTGRVGVKMNYTKFNVINWYFNEPAADGGSLVVTSNSQSYWVNHIQTSTNIIDMLMRGRAILEATDDHIRLKNVAGTAEWGINVQSSTGDLRFTVVAGAGKATFGLAQLDCGVLSAGNEIRAGTEVGGSVGRTTFTSTTNLAANSSGVGSILFKGTTSRDSAGFIKIFIGTTAYYVPVFSAITG